MKLKRFHEVNTLEIKKQKGKDITKERKKKKEKSYDMVGYHESIFFSFRFLKDNNDLLFNLSH